MQPSHTLRPSEAGSRSSKSDVQSPFFSPVISLRISSISPVPLELGCACRRDSERYTCRWSYGVLSPIKNPNSFQHHAYLITQLTVSMRSYWECFFVSATQVHSTPTPWKTSVRHPEYLTSLPPSGAPDDDLSFHSTPALPTNPNWRCLCVWTASLEATASISHIVLISQWMMHSHSVEKNKRKFDANCRLSIPSLPFLFKAEIPAKTKRNKQNKIK